MGSLEINVSRVTDGKHEYAFIAPARDLGSSEAFPGDVRVTAELERQGKQFLLTAQVESRGAFICDRCLRGFERDIHGQFRTLFVPEGFSREALDETDEVRTLAADALVITLDDDVRQSVELAIPWKLLCKEDCRGLCRSCGKDLNEGMCGCESEEIDPRWEPLKKLSRS